jgi:hypothetical protein
MRIQQPQTPQQTEVSEPQTIYSKPTPIPVSGRAPSSLRQGWTNNNRNHNINQVLRLSHCLTKEGEPGNSSASNQSELRAAWLAVGQQTFLEPHHRRPPALDAGARGAPGDLVRLAFVVRFGVGGVMWLRASEDATQAREPSRQVRGDEAGPHTCQRQ